METPVLIAFDSHIQALDYLKYWYVELTPSILEVLPGHSQNKNFNQRLIIRIDEAETWQCGVLALGEGSGLITVQKARLKRIGKTLGDAVKVELWEDHSEFGVEIPEELIVFWDQVPESKHRFDHLKPSMQRYILNYISTAKSTEKRIERTVLLMQNLLLSTVGKENFRFLLGKE